MIPEPQNSQNVNTAIFIMASLSPLVKSSVELELYRGSAESDESTEQYILDHCFVEMIKDIENIGVVLSIDYDGITEDMGRLFSFLQFASYLLPNSLYDIIKTNSAIKQCIDHILEGNLGENETFIETYLSELGGLEGQPPLVPELSDTLDQFYPIVSQTEVFTDTMRQLSLLAMTEKMMIESDPQAHTAYRNAVRDLISRLSDVVNLYTNDPVYDQLCIIQNWIIKDLTRPSNFVEYNYLLTVSPNTLPSDLISSYSEKWYHYKCSSMWCLEYYTVRNLPVLPPHLIMMYAFIYAVTVSPIAYEKETQTLRAKYLDDVSDEAIRHLYQESPK